MADKQRSRSGAFLIELLIIIAVFSLCCAAGVSVLAVADREMRYSEQLTNAQHIAADIAERYKAGDSLGEIVGEENIGTAAKKEYSYDNGKTLTASLSERVDGAVKYLNIKISDAEYEYTAVTCAKTGGDAYE